MCASGREEPADTAGAFEFAAEVFAASVGDMAEIVCIALLDHEIAVINVTDFVGEGPRAGTPSVFFADAAAHLPS